MDNRAILEYVWGEDRVVLEIAIVRVVVTVSMFAVSGTGLGAL